MVFREFFTEPWQGLDMLQQEMNRLFGEFFPTPERTARFPLVNMWGTENEVVITAELSGINANELELNVVADTLTIQGKRIPPPEGEAKDVVYHRKERVMGDFKRTLKLPFRIEAEKVEAKYEKGVLEIKLPRAEQDKPRQIKVQGS